MQNLFLVAAVICFGMAAIKLFTAKMPSNRQTVRTVDAAKRGYREITLEEAQTRLAENESAILLDVRSQEEYDRGHIPGAVCFPGELIGGDMPFAFDKDAEILVCSEFGERSAEAAEKLAALGYSNVFDLDGIQKWPGELTKE